MKSSSEGGFTLIEVVLTAVVLAVMFLAIFGMFNSLRTVNARANNLTIATEAAQQQLEKARNLPYAAIPIGTTDTTSQLAAFPQLGAARNSNTVATIVDNRGLKSYEVTINYFDRGVAKQLKVSTLIALNGIDR